MSIKKVIKTEWFPEKELLITQISGDLDQNDIEQWERSLQAALARIKDHGRFKIFVNLHGFKATDITAHKQYRTIIPLVLAEYGWKVGYVDLFEEDAKTMKFTHNRGIRCVAAVHCHHDETKIDLYESRFSRTNERFLTDPQEALNWIENLRLTA